MTLAIRSILVCTDFADAAKRALDSALPIARAFNADLALLHVLAPPAPVYVEALGWPSEGLEKAALHALGVLGAAVAKEYAATEAILVVGDPCERILDYVKTHPIDLVIIGTRGRKGLPRMVLGSVAEKVVRLSSVPVLTVHEE